MTCRSDVLKTYDVVAPMGGLAVMAWKLACHRRAFASLSGTPVSRSACEADHLFYNVSGEYYEIIDRITRGEQP